MVLHILLTAAVVIVLLFVVTFTVYWFDLDMKLVSKIYFALQKHYDHMERDRKL